MAENEHESRQQGARRALLLLGPANMLLTACHTVLNPLKTLIQEDLRCADAQSTLPGLAAELAVVLAAPLIGLYLSQEGACRRRVLVAGAMLTSVCTCLLAGVHHIWLMCLLRVLGGAGSAATAVVIPSLLVDFYPVHDRSYVFALYQVSNLFGGASSYASASLVAEFAGWKAAVLSIGVPALTFASSLQFIREPKPGVHDAAAATGLAQEPVLKRYQAVLRNPHFLAISSASAMNTFAESAAAEWFPTLLQRYDGQTVGAAGVEVALAGMLGGLLGAALGAKAVRYWQHGVKNIELLVPAVASLISLLACMACVSLEVSNAPTIVALAASWVSCFAISTVSLWVLLTKVFTSSQLSLAVSFQTLLTSLLGHATAAPATGWLSDRLHSLRSAMHLPIVVQLTSGLVLLLSSWWLNAVPAADTAEAEKLYSKASLLSLFSIDDEVKACGLVPADQKQSLTYGSFPASKA